MKTIKVVAAVICDSLENTNKIFALIRITSIKRCLASAYSAFEDIFI